MNPVGILFDMDDTLVSTASLWKQAEDHLLTRLGSGWSADLARQYKGMNALDVAAVIHRTLQPKESLEECQTILRNALFAAFESHPPAPMPGAIACVNRLAQSVPLALASGSPLPLIECVVKHLGLRAKFQSLISSESVPRGKPAPDVFLAAAAALGIPPHACLVIEDSLVGVQAAKAAGMGCFAVPSSHADEIAKAADRTFASLEEIFWPEIELTTRL